MGQHNLIWTLHGQPTCELYFSLHCLPNSFHCYLVKLFSLLLLAHALCLFTCWSVSRSHVTAIPPRHQHFSALIIIVYMFIGHTCALFPASVLQLFLVLLKGLHVYVSILKRLLARHLGTRHCPYLWFALISGHAFIMSCINCINEFMAKHYAEKNVFAWFDCWSSLSMDPVSISVYHMCLDYAFVWPRPPLVEMAVSGIFRFLATFQCHSNQWNVYSRW